MILTTTNNIEGSVIREYKGIVFGEVVNGTDFIRDIGAGFRDLFGGRSDSYEETMNESREEALREMSQRAEALGANAVVGVKVDYEVINSMFMVSASGTAVVI